MSIETIVAKCLAEDDAAAINLFLVRRLPRNLSRLERQRIESLCKISLVWRYYDDPEAVPPEEDLELMAELGRLRGKLTAKRLAAVDRFLRVQAACRPRSLTLDEGLDPYISKTITPYDAEEAMPPPKGRSGYHSDRSVRQAFKLCKRANVPPCAFRQRYWN